MRFAARLAGTLCLFLATSSTAMGQDRPTPSPREATLGWSTPFATLGVHGGFGQPDEELSVYVYWTKARDDGGEKGFAVRRASSSDSSGSKVDWATSSACPGLEQVIVDLEAVPMPMIDVPTVGRQPRQGPPLDGVTFSLWSRYPTWPDAFSYSVELSSNLGTPLADWAGRLRQTLVACWTDTMPSAVGKSS